MMGKLVFSENVSRKVVDFWHLDFRKFEPKDEDTDEIFSFFGLILSNLIGSSCEYALRNSKGVAFLFLAC